MPTTAIVRAVRSISLITAGSLLESPAPTWLFIVPLVIGFRTLVPDT
jgi:hypothetical protein